MKLGIYILLFIIIINILVISYKKKEGFVGEQMVNTAIVTGIGMGYDMMENGTKAYLGKKNTKKYNEVFSSMRNTVKKYRDELNKYT